MFIFFYITGEKFSSAMLMSVIRFLLPTSDHTIKKLLLIYWEIVPKRDANGTFHLYKMKQNMRA